VNSYQSYPFIDPEPVDDYGDPLPDDRNEIRCPFTALDLEVEAIVESVQMHKCHPSCFKYGPGECRYQFPKDKVSATNIEQGFVEYERDDPQVNNYNPWVLAALRCNMDVQFITSGKGGKAMIYYVSNYMTKSQLKVRVSCLLIELTLVFADP